MKLRNVNSIAWSLSTPSLACFSLDLIAFSFILLKSQTERDPPLVTTARSLRRLTTLTLSKTMSDFFHTTQSCKHMNFFLHWSSFMQ